ncbi:MAG: 4Fe-4S binding protein [bacterium]
MKISKSKRKVEKKVLIIGGSLAGFQLASDLVKLGIKPVIVEAKNSIEEVIAGLRSEHLFDKEVDRILDGTKGIIEKNRIELNLSTRIRDVRGQIGDFMISLVKEKKQDIDIFVPVVIIASNPFRVFCKEDYDLDLTNNILSLAKLEKLVESNDKGLKRLLTPNAKKEKKSIAFIINHSDKITKISSISALKQALYLKEEIDSKIYIFYQDIQVSGEGLEALYKQAREEGILFFRYHGEQPPKVNYEEGLINILYNDLYLDNVSLDINCDLLVLDDEISVLDSNTELNLFNINKDAKGFLQKENIRLQPSMSNRPGIYVIGGGRGASTNDAKEIIDEAKAVALQVYSLLSKGEFLTEKVLDINPEKCVLCLTCIRTCPHKAISVGYYKAQDKRVAEVDHFACQKCGVCAAECPDKAIQLLSYADERILEEVGAR